MRGLLSRPENRSDIDLISQHESVNPGRVAIDPDDLAGGVAKAWLYRELRPEHR